MPFSFKLSGKGVPPEATKKAFVSCTNFFAIDNIGIDSKVFRRNFERFIGVRFGVKIIQLFFVNGNFDWLNLLDGYN
jgi:hypothetical protein